MIDFVNESIFSKQVIESYVLSHWIHHINIEKVTHRLFFLFFCVDNKNYFYQIIIRKPTQGVYYVDVYLRKHHNYDCMLAVKHPFSRHPIRREINHTSAFEKYESSLCSP